MEDNSNCKTEFDTDKTTFNITVPSGSEHQTVATMDINYDGSDPPKQKDIESTEKATLATIAKTDSGIKKTLRIRIQKLTKCQLDEAITQRKEISNQRATNTKANKSTKKSHASSSDTKARSSNKVPKFAISSHSLP